jgi:hypothetical protein
LGHYITYFFCTFQVSIPGVEKTRTGKPLLTGTRPFDQLKKITLFMQIMQIMQIRKLCKLENYAN